MKSTATSPESKRPKVWSETQYANLIRYIPSGTFYARVRVCGKLIRKSLQTDKIFVAKLRLSDFVKDQRQAVRSSAPTDSVRSLAEEVLKQSDSDYTTKPSTKKYRQECLQMLERAAPEMFAMPADKVTQAACAEIAKRLADRYSATRFNGILTVLRALFDLAVERGWCHQNPASPIKRARVSQKELKLPTSEQFESLLAYLDQHSPRGAFLVRFLTFTGCRIDEARHVEWSESSGLLSRWSRVRVPADPPVFPSRRMAPGTRPKRRLGPHRAQGRGLAGPGLQGFSVRELACQRGAKGV